MDIRDALRNSWLEVEDSKPHGRPGGASKDALASRIESWKLSHPIFWASFVIIDGVVEIR